ncbi:MAG: hypothetical protein F2563_03575 [Actinobacteria bacterium]|uniref:Unannotated protein n=1 Tax=freshwater metagenome TaxID=449393 RepID=A0A6J6EPR4_9ZZZZ|nr:hypothetical protein [Actinomycetota bacterium]
MKKLNTIVLLSFLAISLFSCTDAGTLVKVDEGNNDEIEVLKYFYSDGAYVYVARFKDTPNVVSTTWNEVHGKTTVRIGNVVIFENDSVQVLLKNQDTQP